MCYYYRCYYCYHLQAHFETAVGASRKSVNEEDLRRYEEYAANMKADIGKTATFSFDDALNKDGAAADGDDKGDALDDLYG